MEATVTVHDAADPSPTITLVSITSNGPDNGIGDGNTVNDITVLGDYAFEFRAERSGNGVGRVYTITYQATGASGNSAGICNYNSESQSINLYFLFSLAA